MTSGQERMEDDIFFLICKKEVKRRQLCIPMVCEFVDVFPKEFPCLRSHRDMDFSIELYPGTNPISIAPYKMALVELKKLNI